MTDVREADTEMIPAALPPPASQHNRRIAAVAFVRGAALLPVLVVLMVVGSLVSPAFFTVSNLTGVGQQVSALGRRRRRREPDPADRRAWTSRSSRPSGSRRWSPRG